MPFRLPLRAPLETAHGTIRERRGWLLELQDEAGCRGQGEASPLAGFGMESPTVCAERLADVSRWLVGRDAADLDELLDDVAMLAPAAPGVLAAVDIALHDLRARTEGVSIAEQLAGRHGRPALAELAINCLIDAASPSLVRDAAVTALRSGHACFKLKLGRLGIDADLERVAALRSAIGAAHKLRLDANAAWSEPEARRALRSLARFDVEYVEQPLAAEDVAGLARLREDSSVQIAVDESASSEAGALAVLCAEAADWLIVKPGACGGLRASWRIAEAAARCDVGVVVTTLLESAIGTAAAWQLAAALPAGRPADGLATSGLFGDDLARLPTPARGVVCLPPGPGLGIRAERDSLTRLAGGELQEFDA